MRNNRQALPVSPELLALREARDEPQLRVYRNISRQEVFEHGPGEVVEVALTKGQHDALVEAGVLAEVTEEELPADAEAALAEDVTTGEEATVVKQEAAEEISADESHEGEQA